jgi:hypothetical protein
MRACRGHRPPWHRTAPVAKGLDCGPASTPHSKVQQTGDAHVGRHSFVFVFAPHVLNGRLHMRVRDAFHTSNTNGHPLRPTWAHSRKPMDLMVSGIVMRLFQASQAASMMAL